MKRSRFTESQIMTVLKQAEAGMQVPEFCGEHGVSAATSYKWRAKFGGMELSLMAKIKELEDEHRQLKMMYIDAQMRILVAEKALAKNE